MGNHQNYQHTLYESSLCPDYLHEEESEENWTGRENQHALENWNDRRDNQNRIDKSSGLGVQYWRGPSSDRLPENWWGLMGCAATSHVWTCDLEDQKAQVAVQGTQSDDVGHVKCPSYQINLGNRRVRMLHENFRKWELSNNVHQAQIAENQSIEAVCAAERAFQAQIALEEDGL